MLLIVTLVTRILYAFMSRLLMTTINYYARSLSAAPLLAGALCSETEKKWPKVQKLKFLVLVHVLYRWKALIFLY